MSISPESYPGENAPNRSEINIKDEMSRDAVLFAQVMNSSRFRYEPIKYMGMDFWGKDNAAFLGPKEDRYWIVRRQFLYDTSGDLAPIESHCGDYSLTRGRGFTEARHLGLGLYSTLCMGFKSLQYEKVDIVITSAGKILPLVHHNSFTEATILETSTHSLNPERYICADDLRTAEDMQMILQMWRDDLQKAKETYSRKKS